MQAESNWADPGLWDLFDLSPLFERGPQAYLSVALQRCVQWFRAAGGSIFLFSDESQAFELNASCGLQSRLPKDTCFKFGQGIGGIVAESGLPRVLHDPRDEPDLAANRIGRRGDIGSSMVIPLHHSDGRVIGVINISRGTSAPLFDESDLEQARTLADHMALAIANARIVADLKSESEERQHTNERLVGVLDSVAGAVVVVDANGNVLNHNASAMRESFFSDEARTDLTDVRRVLRCAMEQTLRTAVVTQMRAHDPVADRTWLIQASPMGSGGAVLMVQDVSEHERSQAEVARTRRWAEIGQMTAAIAHEIRNPLTGILSASQMIGSHPDTATEFAKIIEEEVRKLNKLCDEFLEFAKPMRLNLAPTNLCELVRRCVLLTTPEAEAKTVQITEDFDDAVPIIELDQPRIEQVVLNLIRNAIQASLPESEVVVSVRNNQISVSDQGSGMTSEQKSRLFSPFYTTKPDGTGLGLCNVRKIVDAHASAIEVESELGQGSRFTVDFVRKTA